MITQSKRLISIKYRKILRKVYAENGKMKSFFIFFAKKKGNQQLSDYMNSEGGKNEKK